MNEMLLIKKYKKTFCITVLVCLLIEIFVCNFRFWESLGWNSYDLLQTKSVLLEDNQFEENEMIVASFQDNGWCDILTEDILINANNIYLNCKYIDTSGNIIENTPVTVTLKARDEGHELEYTLGSRTISPLLERTHYNRLNLSGNIKSIKLTFSNPDKNKISGIKIFNFSFNQLVPFHFSFLRFFVILFFVSIIVLFRPKSDFYNLKFSDNFKGKKAILIFFLAFSLAISLFCVNINRQYNTVDKYYTQYHALTEAILDGHVYLDEKPAEALAEMDNPYDTNYRKEFLDQRNQSYHLDHAYYNGKYYVYFGIIPVLMLFLPFYAITGTHLTVTIAISFFGFFYIVGSFFFLWSIFKKYFKNIAFGIYLLSCLMLSVTSGMFYAFRGPSFYALPILAAAAFSIWGLVFWVKAVEYDGLSLSYTSLGALCIALTAGCRPQFLIVGATSLIWYKKQLFSKKFLLKKNWFLLMTSLAVPVIIVAIGVFYYNYIRFDSVFDFGANYNLTSNDMTHRGWHWDRVPLGLFYYLFDPTKISPVFPFFLPALRPVEDHVIKFTNYLGQTITEGNFGGLVYNRLILGIPLFSGFVKKYCDKKVFLLSVLFSVMAIFVLIMDTQMAGIVARYIMDFGWMFCVSSILLLASVEDRCPDNTTKNILRMLLLISVVWGMIYEFFLFFNESSNTSLITYNSEFYYKIESLTQFWL